MRLSIALLAACSSPSHAPAPPPRTPPADAALDAPTVDAAIAVFGPCDWNRPDANNPKCAPENTPLMRCRDVNGPSARFPSCIEDKPAVVAPEPIILAIKQRGVRTARGIHIVVAGGANRGIDKTWRAILIDSDHRALVNGALSYVRVDPDEIEAIARLTPDELARATAVEFRPPP